MKTKPDFDNPDGLSRVWAGRYHTLKPRYQGKTPGLLKEISPRGVNSFDNVYGASEKLHATKGAELDYQRSLIAAVALNKELIPNDVMDAVCSVRAKHNLPAFTGNNILRQCLVELRKVFILKDIAKPGPNGKNYRVYRPVFALLVE